MNRIQRDSSLAAAVRDWSSDVWELRTEDFEVSGRESLLLQPRRALGGLSHDGPMEAYKRLLPLVETPAIFPSDVMHSGARALQRHFSFAD